MADLNSGTSASWLQLEATRAADATLRNQLERCIGYAREVNPSIQVLCVSAQTGEGMQAWYVLLRERVAGTRVAASVS